MTQVTTGVYECTLTLANAIQLASDVTREIAGNDISDSIDGAKINNESLSKFFALKIAKYLRAQEG